MTTFFSPLYDESVTGSPWWLDRVKSGAWSPTSIVIRGILPLAIFYLQYSSASDPPHWRDLPSASQRESWGATSRVPDQSAAALVLFVDERPAVRAASPMSLGS